MAWQPSDADRIDPLPAASTVGWKPSDADLVTDQPIDQIITAGTLSEADLASFLRDNPDLAQYQPDTYKTDALAGRSATGPQEPAATPYRQGLYQDVRSVLGYPAGALTATIKALDVYPENNPNSYWARYKEDLPGEIYAAQHAEGVPGFLASPLNLAATGVPYLFKGVPSAASKILEAAQAGKLGTRVGEVLKDYPSIARLIGGAGEGAGYTLADEALDPNKTVSGRDMAIGAGIGAAFNVAGGALGDATVTSYPGVKKMNKALLKSGQKNEVYSPAEIEQYLTEMRAAKRLPFNGYASMENLADAKSSQAGALYESGLDAVQPAADAQGISILRDFRNLRDEIAARPSPDGFETALAAGFGRNLEARAGTPEYIRAQNERILSDLKDKLVAGVWKQNQERKLGLAEDEMTRYVDDVVERLRTQQAEKPGQSRELDQVILEPRDVLGTKAILNKDIYNTRMGEVTSRQRTMAKSMHKDVDATAEEYATLQGKGYKELIGDAPKLYRQASRIEDLLEAGKYGGTAWKLGEGSGLGGSGMAHYLTISPQYWLNNVLWRAAKSAPNMSKIIISANSNSKKGNK